MSKHSTPSSNVVQLADVKAAVEASELTDTESAAKDLRETVQAELERRGLSHAQASKEIGVSKTTFTKGLTNDVPWKDAVADKIDAWLDEHGVSGEQMAVPGALPKEPRFVTMPTADKMLAMLAYCHTSADLGCIYGAAGVGKTRATRQYQADFPNNVFIMTASPEVATVHPMLEELSRAVGLEDCVGGSRTISRAIRARLMAAKKPFLIIDEAQHLNLTALESLRSIHDETEAGLVLVGNTMVYERLTGGSRAAHFAQLFSRMGAQLHVKRALRQDVSALIAAWKLTDQKSIEYLSQIARRPGALRGLTKVLRLAIAAVDGDVRKVRIEHIKFAARNLGQEIVL